MGKDDLAIRNGFTFCYYSSFFYGFFDGYIDVALWLVVKLLLVVNHILSGFWWY